MGESDDHDASSPFFFANGGVEEDWQYEEIILETGGEDLGFSIAGGTDTPHVGTDPSIYVTTLSDGGKAAVDGRLRLNDILVKVNDVRVVDIPHLTAVDALKIAGNTVHLTVKRKGRRPAKLKMLEIDLVKGDEGFGVSIAGGINSQHVSGDNGIYVVGLTEGGPADLDGRLAYEDKLLAVGDKNIENVTHEEAGDALNASGDNLKLVVGRSMDNDADLDVENPLPPSPPRPPPVQLLQSSQEMSIRKPSPPLPSDGLKEKEGACFAKKQSVFCIIL